MAVARVLAGRGKLPGVAEQLDWEAERLNYKGPSALFHEIAPDFKEYFECLRAIAGPPAKDTSAYELPPYGEDWADIGTAVLSLKDAYVKSLQVVPSKILAKAKL